ncbi:MAG TPA: TetR/AcrR family transcriptional regulator [Anaerolineales bacterium]|nr:TetR/AcrR family transcriptional regulator [Anaerolineales bacterium]
MLSTFPKEKLDPRVIRTRQLLEQAFLGVASEKGFQAVSVQDITERAGVNRATFYAHFPDKYALLDYSIRQGFRQELEKRMLNVCTFSIDNLRAMIIAVCEYISTASAHCNPPSQQFESVMETQVKMQIQELIQKWIENWGTTIDPKIAATAASWAIYGLADQWSHDKNKKRPSVEEFSEQVLPLIAGNLSLTQIS